MRLNDILKGIEYSSLVGDREVEVCSLCFDSRRAEQGALYVARRGTVSDGHTYTPDVVARGAVAVICEELPAEPAEGVTWVVVPSSDHALGLAAANFYDNPSHKLHLVGVTGTNGKTTTATLLYELFEGLGYKAGLISTVVYRLHNISEPSTHTTPDPLTLNRLLAEMVEMGCEYCFMEVSSHSIVQERIGGLRFEVAAFTNITHDHLDYHKTFAEYIKAKKRLFDLLPADAVAMVNADDRNGEVMVQNSRARQVFYSTRGVGDHNCKVLEMGLEGMLLDIDGEQLWVRLIGKFNASNILAVYSIASALGVERGELLVGLSTLRSVKGRFEQISSGGVTAIVDYAHTPDALDKVLDTITEMEPQGKIITVVGCGGERDRTKRPEMAAIAVGKSQLAIFTSDNPRSEEPNAIIEEMVAGVGAHCNYLCIADRAQAIRTAVMTASAGDVILVAGKGHEEYQVVGKEHLPFSDQQHLVDYFKQKSSVK
ncbi:MAG: UDP-N-acetylmuramoyl-L-alanyl-D-glutamate--2,6-diaminopimelate ligase [Tidjanibacter sp.]|nr:UDP-N-acetylmuramoyl-L-alanyl-D-glutamate--2,6-diaminopimelate ligase [Tidjanibacter sp.]